jgi:fermentation-respiration switch protein FrsA (DUF1100 family)
MGNARRLAAPTALALGILLMAILLLGGAVALDRQFVFYPTTVLEATPRELGLAYDDVRFGEDGRLHGWFVPGSGGSNLTLLWFHGNAGNISHRLDWIRLLRSGLGINIFIFDYAGYGLSRGTPSEQGTYRDARDALAYLRSRPDVERDRIVYFGKSLGGAVAVQLAVEEPPYRLVTNATFRSILDLARRYYPFVPVGLLIRSRFPTLDRIGQVRAPILIAHGVADTLVPPDHARRLYEAAAEPKRLYLVEGAGHNDLLPTGGERYLETLRAFLLPQ